MPKPISNSEDVIDSRDVIARIEELKDDQETYDDRDIWAQMYPDEAEELEALEKLAEEGENDAAEWEDGAILVRDSHFETYAEELAEELGLTHDDQRWPYTHIDWAAAANDLKQDYSEIEFDGVTYWVRA